MQQTLLNIQLDLTARLLATELFQWTVERGPEFLRKTMSKSDSKPWRCFWNLKYKLNGGKSILKRKNSQVVNSSTVNFLFKFTYKLDILMKQKILLNILSARDFNVGCKLHFTSEYVCLQCSWETPQTSVITKWNILKRLNRFIWGIILT